MSTSITAVTSAPARRLYDSNVAFYQPGINISERTHDRNVRKETTQRIRLVNTWDATRSLPSRQ